MIMPTDLDIDVTADIINQGTPQDACDCPVALAVIRAFEQRGHEVMTVGVTPRDVDVWVDEEYACYKLPEDVRQFITDFDKEEDVVPIKTRLRRELP